jgi:K+-sensing histidine kinase KdpD
MDLVTAMKKYLLHNVVRGVALLVLAASAWAITLIRWEPAQEVIPIAFLAMVLGLGMLFGRTVGILGSIVGALVFAYALYRPLGSLSIRDQGARADVGWMLLAGVALSYLLLPSHHDHSPGAH